MSYGRKHSFQFGFQNLTTNPFNDGGEDEERERLNPFQDEAEEDDIHDASPSSPYLIPTSPVSTIARSPTFSTRSSSQFLDSEPTDAYPDDDARSTYNFRDHLKHEPLHSTRYTRRFKSRLIKGGVDKPWLKDKDPREKWVTILPIIGMLLGCGLAAYLGYSGWASVETHKFCLVYEDDFSTFRDDIWKHEVQVGGFGTGEFEWTTADSANSYVVNDTLVIMPTLTDEVLSLDQVNNGYTLNLTTQGTCTSPDWHQCVAISNSTSQTVINPVRSARLTTKATKSIKYGKVEVVAKLPVGDWLWPAIWMMPVNDTYGQWPNSGEIDIMESRGNSIKYDLGGIDSYSSTLHWGSILSSVSNIRTRSSSRSMVANILNSQNLSHGL
jgi:Glycosyl hydrolases family 16